MKADAAGIKSGSVIHLRKKRGVIVFIAVLTVLVLTSGCTRPGSLLVLDEDAFNRERGFESVVFWRLKVLDKTGTVSSRPRLSIYRPGLSKKGGPDFDKPIPEHAEVNGEWTKRNGIPAFEGMVVAASKPEQYLFKNITFFLYTDYLPNYFTGGYEERDVDLTVPLSRLCTIPPGKLVYLGEMVIEFLKEDKAGYSYRVSFVQEVTDSDDAAKQFREAYPGLFKRFNRSVEPVSWKVLLVENFNANENAWTVPAGDKHVYAGFSNGKYSIQSKNDECHWAGTTPSFDRPHDFDVELASASTSKANGEGHGLALGSDRENAYNFLISRSGQAKIELYKNGDPQPTLVTGVEGAVGEASDNRVIRQKVEARGDMLRYYLNGRYVGEIKNELDLKTWYLGLAVCGRQTVELVEFKHVERC
jgi:hypothetical protein